MQPRNHKRQRIIDNNLMIYKDNLKISDRNKAVVEEYVAGKSYKEIAEKYSLSPSRVPSIVYQYIWHCTFYKSQSHIYRIEE